MLWCVAVFVSLCGAALASHHIETPHGNFSTAPISMADRAWLRQRAESRQRLSYPGFHFLYVRQDGLIRKGARPTTGSWVEVIGSPQTAMTTLYLAAAEVGKMFKHSPQHIFDHVASTQGAGLGVFSAQEKLTVFPEFANLRDTPACKGRCDGGCANTCTFDGRKYELIAGLTSTRAVVLADNVVCRSNDPYYHRYNVLVHEMGHCIEFSGLSYGERNAVISAYNNARRNSLWNMASYAMSNHAEYFAQGTSAWFFVNQQYQSKTMNDCRRGSWCGSEKETRNMMSWHDPNLFASLSATYTNSQPSLPGNFQVCDTIG